MVVLPVFPDGRILLIRQYRHAARQYMWELVAGHREPHETFLESAPRELQEETGYTARRFTKLLDIYPSPGLLSEKMEIYLAEDLTKGKSQARGRRKDHHADSVPRQKSKSGSDSWQDCGLEDRRRCSVLCEVRSRQAQGIRSLQETKESVSHMENSEVANILRETAQLLEIDGAIIGRYRSYEKVAELLESMHESHRGTLAKDEAKLRELPGIGEGMADAHPRNPEDRRLLPAPEAPEKISAHDPRTC